MTEDSKKMTMAAPTGGLATGQRWSAARKLEVVLQMLGGEPNEALSRELGAGYAGWRRGARRRSLGSTRP
jgi:hypothetical protein